MIILLDSQLEELFSIPRLKIEKLFSKCVEADYNGYHCFLITRDVGKWALDNLNLGDRLNAHLKHIYQSVASRNGVIHNAKTFVTVKLQNTNITVKRNGSYDVGYEFLINGRGLERATQIVVESVSSDGVLFEKIITLCRKLFKINSIDYEFVHGGGSEIPKVFQTQVQKRVFCVCIADSDKVSPMGQASRTCLKLNRYYASVSEQVVGSVFITPTREIENIIPFQVIRDLNCYKGIAVESSLISNINKNDPANPWYFLDVKNGFCGSDFITECSFDRGVVIDTHPEVTFWSDAFSVANNNLANINQPGFGNNVIQNLLKCGQSMSQFREFIRSAEFISLFGEFFEKIVWHLYASRRTIV